MTVFTSLFLVIDRSHVFQDHFRLLNSYTVITAFFYIRGEYVL